MFRACDESLGLVVRHNFAPPPPPHWDLPATGLKQTADGLFQTGGSESEAFLPGHAHFLLYSETGGGGEETGLAEAEFAFATLSKLLRDKTLGPQLATAFASTRSEAESRPHATVLAAD